MNSETNMTSKIGYYRYVLYYFIDGTRFMWSSFKMKMSKDLVNFIV